MNLHQQNCVHCSSVGPQDTEHRRVRTYSKAVAARHGCLCNCSGEANGTAYVQFETVAMAKDAFERYNDVALDGKPMKIAFDNGNTQILTSGIT